MMRFLILLIAILTNSISFAQKDETYFFIDLTPGVMVTRFNEITYGVDYTTYSSIYQKTESRSFNITGIGHLGLNVPFYRTETGSIGMKLSAGLGTTLAVSGDDRYTGTVLLDLPQFLYYRKVTPSLDFSILSGYKLALIGEHFTKQFLMGVEFGPGFVSSLRIYGTPFGYRLFREYSTGELEPILSYYEFGFGLVLGL